MTSKAATPESIDVVFSFDTTGSMYPCLTQVRREVEKTVKRLFAEIPNLRVGITAHGDYCDAGHPYVTKTLDHTTDQQALCKFVRNVEPTNGGDSPECYELVLHESRSLAWKSGRTKVLVLIGDDVPHGPNESQNTKKLDWRNELDLLLEAGIKVYAVQALGRTHATKFYEEMARKTGGFHLNLNQFSDVTDLVMAVCYRQVGEVNLQNYQAEVQKAGRMNRSLDAAFNKMMGKAPSKSVYGDADLHAVPEGRFQVLKVDEDCRIDEFVRDQGLVFKTGRGFYELTKPVLVQGTKEVVLRHKKSGDFFSGDKAREMVGLPALADDVDTKLKPVALDDYVVFIQSTSNNRKLIGKTKFLYEVADWV
jgi:hypothetical protein